MNFRSSTRIMDQTTDVLVVSDIDRPPSKANEKMG